MDGHKYRQVLFNLVGNAVKFSDNGRITIKGSVVSENEECYTCKIEVIDEGVGISEEDQKNLFKEYEQVGGDFSNAIKGTGLGLSIVEGLVKVLGGEVGIESKLGEGSNFWFTYKARRINGVIEKRRVKEELPQAFNAMVLVIDDNRTNLLVASSLLNHLGVEIKSCL